MASSVSVLTQRPDIVRWFKPLDICPLDLNPLASAMGFLFRIFNNLERSPIEGLPEPIGSTVVRFRTIELCAHRLQGLLQSLKVPLLRLTSDSDKSHGMTEPATNLFHCPTCEAEYQLVRVEAEPPSTDRELACVACGGPLNGREGGLALKYFYVDRRSKKRRGVQPIRRK